MVADEPIELEPYQLIPRSRLLALTTEPSIVLVVAVGAITLTITTRSLRTIGALAPGDEVAMICLPDGALAVRAIPADEVDE